MKFKVMMVLLMFFLIGCKSKELLQKSTLNYWDCMPPTDSGGIAIKELIKDFEQKNPGIEVKYQYITWGEFDNKLLTSIAGGLPPDVVMIDRFRVGSYGYHNALMILDDFVKKDKINAKNYWECCWNEIIYNRHIWAIPHFTDVRALFYRVDHFKEAGLDPDKPPKTWDELYEYAKKLTKRDKYNRFERIGFLPYYGNTWLYLWGWLNGGEFMKDGKITINDHRIVEALDWTIKFEQLYGGPQIVNTAISGYGNKEMDPFIMGRLSMKIDGDYQVRYIEKYGPNIEYRVAPPPAPKGRKTLTWSGGFAYAIPRGVKNPDISWKFVKFITSKEAQLKYTKICQGIPSLIEVTKEPFYTNNPKYKVFIDLMKVSRYRPVTPVGSYLWNELEKSVEYVRAGSKTAQQALNEAQEKVTQELIRMDQIGK